MKLNSVVFFKRRFFLSISIICVLVCTLVSESAFCQIDYSYGSSKPGLRLGIGIGTGTLDSYWTGKSTSATINADLDYVFSPYFSIGLQEQYASLTGTDANNIQYYPESKFYVYNTNLNFKFGIGLIADFNSDNGFTDAIKRTYFGLGVGSGFSLGSVYNTASTNSAQPGTLVPGHTSIRSDKTFGFTNNSISVPFSIGTDINLFGSDKTILSPAYQYNYMVGPNSKYFDGYQPLGSTTTEGYDGFTLTIKFKL